MKRQSSEPMVALPERSGCKHTGPCSLAVSLCLKDFGRSVGGRKRSGLGAKRTPHQESTGWGRSCLAQPISVRRNPVTFPCFAEHKISMHNLTFCRLDYEMNDKMYFGLCSAAVR